MTITDGSNGKSNYQKYKQAAASALRWDGQIQSTEEQILASSRLLTDDLEGVVADLAEGLAPEKKHRGRNKATIELVKAMKAIAEACRPITGRGIGYKVFALKLIGSMSRRDMGFVYRALLAAREDGDIPWHWIVDEGRGLEQVRAWLNPRRCADTFYYRRELWQTQKVLVEVWSEKGTVREVLWPVLADYGVGFRVMHGFNSATEVHNAAEKFDGRPLIVLYIGDFDPSGMCMSEMDLPARIKRYDGHHIDLQRIALIKDQTETLPFFPASDKAKDKRYKWFVKAYGDRCWELDAMDPVALRELVKAKIVELIDRPLWEEQERLQAREKDALEGHLRSWASLASRPVPAKSDLLITPTTSLFGLRGFRSNGWGIV